MTWTKLDDNFMDRPAVLAVSRDARLLHIEALIWCNKALSDGRVPRAALRRLTDLEDPHPAIDELIDAELWETDGDAGWWIDWTDQESSDVVTERRENDRKRKELSRRRKELHQAGDHSICLPTYCEHARRDRDATRDRTRDTTRDRTRDETRESGGSHATPSRPSRPSRPQGREDGGEGRSDAAGASAGAPDPSSPTPRREATPWSLGIVPTITLER